MSNHMPVFYTWEGQTAEGGGKKRETKVRIHFLYEPLLTHTAANPVQTHLSSFSSCLTLPWRSCSFMLSLSFKPPPPLAKANPHPSLLLRKSHEGSDSCFTLDKLHIWQLHVCPGLPPVFTHTRTHTPLLHYHTQSDYYVLRNHRWDDNLQHGNATFPTNEAEISCCSYCVPFDITYNKSLCVCYLCPKVDFNCFKWGTMKEICC